ncbi:MAG: hypothetical protein AAF488_11190 [Planctomycetota bacterium]
MSELPRVTFEPYEIERLSPLVATGLDPSEIPSLVAPEIDRDVARMHDEEFAATFHKYCPIDGATSEDYRRRLVSLPATDDRAPLTVIVGIRFLGGDTAHPFVEVERRSRALTRVDDLNALRAHALEPLSVFSAPKLRLFLTPEEETRLAGIPSEPDLRWVVGRIEHLRSLRPPSTKSKIELRPPEDLSFYERYEAAHTEVARTFSPLMQASVRLESRKSLQQALDDHALFELWEGDTWSGIIAAVRGTGLGLPGFEVYEELLAENVRGRGIAAGVQRSFLDRLPSRADDFLFGTILAENLPSLRTALRVGRTDLGGFHFFDSEA